MFSGNSKPARECAEHLPEAPYFVAPVTGVGWKPELKFHYLTTD
jgi:hypothetical protein